MSIKKFEAFQGKEITAVDKFIKSLDLEDSKDIIKFLSNIASSIDRPLSTFKGEYLAAKKAKNMNSDGKFGYLKIFFSISDGVILKTKSSKEPRYSDEYIQKYLNKNGYATKKQLDGPNVRGLTGKLTIVKDIKTLKEDDYVVLNAEGYSNLIHGQIYKEKLENGSEQIYVMTKPSMGYKFNDIPYMISPNEADKKLVKYSYSSYMKILNKDKPIQHTYISLLEDEDKPLYQEMDKIVEDTILFLENNIMTNSDLDSYAWDDARFAKIGNADFALVFDLDKILEGQSLKAMKRDRSSNKSGLLPRIDDEFYKKINKDKYRKLKNKSGETDENSFSKFLVLDILEEAIFVMKDRGRGYMNMNNGFGSERILISLYRLYSEDKITQNSLFNEIEKFDVRLYRDFMFLLKDISDEQSNDNGRHRRGRGDRYNRGGYDYYDNFGSKW